MSIQSFTLSSVSVTVTKKVYVPTRDGRTNPDQRTLKEELRSRGKGGGLDAPEKSIVLAVVWAIGNDIYIGVIR